MATSPPQVREPAHDPSTGSRRRAPAGADPPSDRSARSSRTHDVCTRLSEVGLSPDAERELREELVVLNMPVARAVAGRYRNRGIATEDLEQVAYLGLVKAAHSFDGSAGHDFLTYAVPTMRGEVLRHFRDLGWVVRPPRRVQELQARISASEAELSTRLGRAPRPQEIAELLEEPTSSVVEANSALGCFAPASLDAADDGQAAIGELLGKEDAARRSVEARVVLAPVVRQLSTRDRRVLMMRFFDDRTQQEIGEEIGVTQAQVSRMLRGILARLKHDLDSPQGSASPTAG